MFNEENSASSCVDKVLAKISRIKNKIMLVVIDDGSTDKTPKILKLKKIQYKDRLIILTHRKNKGYGATMQTGINYGIKEKYDFYLAMDSDLTNPPKYISKFINAISDDVDCIKASRYIKGGKVVNVPLFRQIISIVGNNLASRIFNVDIKDCTNGFRMVRLRILKRIRFKENNFSIILEEMYYLKKMGAKFAEIPNVLYARDNSKSHFTYKPRIFYDYFKYILKSLALRFQ